MAVEHSALWEAMKASPDSWIETTEEMWWEQLECLPPIRQQGGAFLVGEPARHNNEGIAVYAGFVNRGERYYARYMTTKQFDNRTFVSSLPRTIK